MRPGIFAKTFASDSLETCLDRVVECGAQEIQFNLALAGGPSLPDAVSPALAERVCRSVRERGLAMAAVSGTYNMAHPDPAMRRRGSRALAALIAAAPALGTGVVTLCTGSRDPDDMWRRHPDNATGEAWRDMRAAVEAAVAVAAQCDVVLAFEPEPGNVVADARAGRRLLDEIASPHLKVVIDGANLVAGDRLDRQAATLDEAFELLEADLVLAHAKDVLPDGTVVAAGRGALDYRRYVALLRDAAYDGSLVLHGLEPHEVPSSLAFLDRLLEPGVVEAS